MMYESFRLEGTTNIYRISGSRAKMMSLIFTSFIGCMFLQSTHHPAYALRDTPFMAYINYMFRYRFNTS